MATLNSPGRSLRIEEHNREQNHIKKMTTSQHPRARDMGTNERLSSGQIPEPTSGHQDQDGRRPSRILAGRTRDICK